MSTSENNKPENKTEQGDPVPNEINDDLYEAKLVDDEEIQPSLQRTSYDVDPEEFSLENISIEAAREYVSAYIQTAKEYERDIEQKEQEFAKWTKRVELALSHDHTDLLEEAQTYALRIGEDLEDLRTKHKNLMLKVDLLKQRLYNKSREFNPTIDTDSLLGQLESITGETAEESKSSHELNNLDIQDKLEQLKRKMNK